MACLEGRDRFRSTGVAEAMIQVYQRAIAQNQGRRRRAPRAPTPV